MSGDADEKFAAVSRRLTEEHAAVKAALEERVAKAREKAAANLT